MKLLGLEQRDIYIAVEFSEAQLRNMQRFFEKALPIFIKVYGDTEEELVDVIQQINVSTEKIIEHVEENIQNGS